MKFESIVNKVLKNPYSAFFYSPSIYPETKSYLFTIPKEIIKIYGINDYEPLLKKVDKIISKGLMGYALIKYEAGYLFENKLHRFLTHPSELAQFVFFSKDNFEEIDSSKLNLAFDDDFSIKNFKLNTTQNEFFNSIKEIKNHIAEGDTYQVNYTVKGKFNFEGSLTSFFKSLIFNQSANYIALINTNDEIIISVSPELFFDTNFKHIETKPMKGTIRRGINFQNDLMLRSELENSEKDRAENLMIVDMLRNDLGKISKYNSVSAEDLFKIEKYESLFQMISKVESTLNKKIALSDVLQNLFPCGSVTGAPKVRTMEIINEIEKENRGYYTGSIGLINKKRTVFNVAIRTITINKKSYEGSIGLGSGIVWDSTPQAEYDEVLLKSNFLLKPTPNFEIFETAKIENNQVLFLDEHLDRMRLAAEFFLFNYDESKIVKRIKRILNASKGKSKRLKIILNKTGLIKIEIGDIPKKVSKVKVIVSLNTVNSTNVFQYFKTTQRKLYDKETKEYSRKGFFDVIYLNEKSEVTEGAITNIFIKKEDVIITPPISSGLLNGVYRKYFLRKNADIKERKIFLSDLIYADQIILTNSLRGEVIVDELFINENEFITYMDK